MSLASSFFVFFAVAIVLSIKLLLIQQSNMDCACAVVHSTDSPPLFQFAFCLDLRGFGLKGSGLARFYCIYKHTALYQLLRISRYFCRHTPNSNLSQHVNYVLQPLCWSTYMSYKASFSHCWSAHLCPDSNSAVIVSHCKELPVIGPATAKTFRGNFGLHHRLLLRRPQSCNG